MVDMCLDFIINGASIFNFIGTIILELMQQSLVQSGHYDLFYNWLMDSINFYLLDECFQFPKIDITNPVRHLSRSLIDYIEICPIMYFLVMTLFLSTSIIGNESIRDIYRNVFFILLFIKFLSDIITYLLLKVFKHDENEYIIYCLQQSLSMWKLFVLMFFTSTFVLSFCGNIYFPNLTIS